jgi:hypothetical protein
MGAGGVSVAGGEAEASPSLILDIVSLRRRRVEQLARLGCGEGRRASLVAVDRRALDVAFGRNIEQVAPHFCRDSAMPQVFYRKMARYWLMLADNWNYYSRILRRFNDKMVILHLTPYAVGIAGSRGATIQIHLV